MIKHHEREIDLAAERAFENKKVEGGNARQHQNKYYWSVRPEIDEFDRIVVAKIGGLRVLEIGCSSGYAAERYAPACRSFVGIDISDAGIAKARSRGLPNAAFEVADAHNLPFKDGEFQAVVLHSLLHHLRIDPAVREIARVLQPQGLLLLREPLGTNPAISLYRRATPGARTRDEVPLSLADLRKIGQFFEAESMRCFGFSALLSAFVRNAGLRGFLLSVDALVARTPLRWLFWQFYAVYTKR
jgi:SAM-dependent methyltransferase